MNLRSVCVSLVTIGLWSCGGGTTSGGDAVKTAGGGAGDAKPGDGAVSPAPPMLDVLFVVDNSVSMCKQQSDLSVAVGALVLALGDAGVDLRAAVVTTDGLSESERGAFHCALPKPFPPNCLEREPCVCLDDADCVEALGAGWVCEPPSQGAQYLTNANGSVNASCRYSCTTDEECTAKFGPAAECVAPGGDLSLRGCLLPPPVDGCPSDVPCTVSSADGTLDQLRCLMVPGALQDKNPQLEQGLIAGVWALDRTPAPGAPDRAAQATAFLREGAWLLVVFVSDEEDCSLGSASLVLELWQVCGLQGDTGSGGPLVPVSDLVTAYQSLGAPGKVLVAAIVGDVLTDAVGDLQCGVVGQSCPAGDDACHAAAANSYFESKGGPGPLAKSSYVCGGSNGQADLGARYIALIEAFGEDGFLGNICTSFQETTAALGAFVVDRITAE